MKQQKKPNLTIVEDDAPIGHAYTIERADGGWVAVDLEYQGSNLISKVRLNEPDIKPIAMERIKIANVHYWNKIG